MISQKLVADFWSLSLDGQLMIEHSPAQPFVTAVRREKAYLADRGTVRTTVRECERIGLGRIRREGERLCFSGGGHKLYMTMEEMPAGIRLRFAGEEGWAYEFRIPAEEDEAVFGGGEQYRQTNLRGERVVNFVSEHIKAATVIQKGLQPRITYRPKPHSAIGSYAPMPIFVTDHGRLIRFETSSDGTADFGDRWYVFSYDACPAALTLQKGGSFPELSGLLARELPNRQYLPDWCLDGMILGIQGGTRTILDKAFAMLDAGAKICGVWSQDWSGCNRTVMGYQVWWNWEADESLYPDLRGAIEKLNARGVKFLAYINPYLVKDSRLYEYCRERGYLITHRDGSVYHIKSTTFDAGMLDLTNPEAVRYIKDTLIKKNMLDLGVSGWMADFGEYLPVDCVLHDGDPAKLHNEWPVLWAKINREAIEEAGREDVMFFTRSGYVGVQAYTPIMWNGDQHTDTTRDYGMPCVMPASFSLGFSGVTLVHCDIGGFFSFLKMHRSQELFTRWMEMSTFSLLMRSHESIRPWANAQFDAEKVKEHTVRLTGIHAKLKPYIAACIRQAQQGIPQIRPDFWEAFDYGESRDMYSYFLGDELFVCPVIREGARSRRVYLPEGDWVLLWTGKEYEGDNSYRIPAPLGKTPVFYKKNGAFAELFRQVAEEN